MADAPENPKTETKVEDKPKDDTFKLAEIRRDGTAVVKMEDGRMFLAKVKEGLAVRKNAAVILDTKDLDKDGVPVDATIVKLA